MKNYTILLFFFCNLTYAHSGWERSVTNYNRQTYKAANQNWMATQHDNGWMYFANNKGLLEFDGTDWNTYSIHNAKTRAVKCGKDGRIYVGGLGQFGYFTPNDLGKLDYTCLSDSLKQAKAGNIWNIHPADDRVYFQSDRSVFCLDGDSLHQIYHTRDIMHSAIVYNKFYIASEEGLSILNGNGFSLLPHARGNINSKIIGLLPFDGQIMVVTGSNGIYLYNGNQLTPYHSAADGFLKTNQLFCVAMKDSMLALGSVQDGVMLLNMESNRTEHTSIGNGLQNKTVLSLAFDRENNLWLGLDNGIDCINLNAPLFFMYSNKSAIGSGYASHLYKGNMYLGTNQGLYVTPYPIPLNKDIDLSLVPGTEGQIWSITEYDDKLFCGAGNALIIVDHNRISKMNGIRGVWSVMPLSHRPDILLAGTYSGLYILRKKDGRWTVSHKVEGAQISAKSMYVEELSNAVWIANKEGGLYRLILSPGLTEAQVKSYNSSILPPGDNVYITKINDEIVVATRKGLFRYNLTKDCLERHTAMEKQLDGPVAYTHVTQDEDGDIWYVTNGMLKLLRYHPDAQRWERSESESYLRGFLIEDFEHIHVYDKQQAIIGTEEGFALLFFNKVKQRKHPLNLQIRRVYLTVGKDSLVYGRSFAYTDRQLVIPYRNNSMRIAYSVNNYDKSLATLYSCRLEGSDNPEWSEYNQSTTKEYTDLKEGDYRFQVKIITDNDKEPVMTDFCFTVLPPWYRTLWAYMVYLFSVAMLLFYVFRRLNAGYRAEILQKSMELLEQKVEFTKESELKDQRIISLEEENLQADLRHKSEELIRTTLNIVRKNEILEDIKKEAVGISHSISEENLPNIRRKMLRLIGHINTNIAHDDDLIRFQQSFDTLHQDFFRKLDDLFPGMNKRERLLCAYIKMDLMSKEIAPLMNISVRGVEISRYRLRKKLKLNPEDSLAEFLQSLNG